ncbi:hypothetical protein Tco_1211940 [Tanacetum coccineum]
MMKEWMARQMEANERIKNQGDVKFIEEYEIEPIPTMPNLNLIHSNSPTVSPFFKDCTVHIPYTNAKTFADDILPNHVGDKELKSIDGVGIGRMPKIKNDHKAGNGGGCLEVMSIDLTRLCKHLRSIYNMEIDRDFSGLDVWFSLTLISLFLITFYSFVVEGTMLKL